jgi:hypothetical protein
MLPLSTHLFSHWSIPLKEFNHNIFGGHYIFNTGSSVLFVCAAGSWKNTKGVLLASNVLILKIFGYPF